MNRLRLAALAALLVLPSLARGQLAGATPEWYLRTPDGCRLFVQEYGTGRDTVVVLHGGWGAEHSYLLDAFAGLEKSYHLVFYDQRGSLRSPCADSLLSVAKHVQDLEQLRTTLHLRQMNIAAHSMGTFLAMSYHERFPSNVRALVLLGAIPPKTPTTADESALIAEQQKSVDAFFIRPEIDKVLHTVGVDVDTANLDDRRRTTRWRILYSSANIMHVERYAQMRGGGAFYNAVGGPRTARTAPRTYDFTGPLLRHPCGVTVIIGDHDYVDWGVRRHHAWTQGSDRARVIVIPDAGHVSWIDAPSAVRKALDDGLRRGIACG